MIRTATPYLILNGQAEQAIAFYERALGARLKVKNRFGDVDKSCPEALRSRVMHAELEVGQARLMLSDGVGSGPVPKEGAINVALDIDDAAEFRRCFEALSEQGAVVQPIIDAPWGALFAAVSDRFGISWMMNGAKG